MVSGNGLSGGWTGLLSCLFLDVGVFEMSRLFQNFWVSLAIRWAHSKYGKKAATRLTTIEYARILAIGMSQAGSPGGGCGNPITCMWKGILQSNRLLRGCWLKTHRSVVHILVGTAEGRGLLRLAPTLPVRNMLCS